MKRIGMYFLAPVETARRLGNECRQRMVLPRHRAMHPGLNVAPLARVRITPNTSKG